ncbi:c-type cytochrome [Parendozoicomonas haliclonae]|uniref:Cytochrome c4 n=1 Tax=Parendozoicomonas haliclonae TaxID=1960125 RepID=A0A1X7AGG3_9GAMM|nr:cytochrome c [Parendozoicomonas haliclonae]SMA38715.1 Cytochrome c4 precursor [Parendozoicomonas haliclonae]
MNMKPQLLWMGLLPVLAYGGGTTTDDPSVQRGRKLAETRCAVCHGGHRRYKRVQNYPSLNGQKANYLEKQLLEYKSGKRDNAVMRSLVINLSDQDIKDVSLWYSLQPLVNK